MVTTESATQTPYGGAGRGRPFQRGTNSHAGKGFAAVWTGPRRDEMAGLSGNLLLDDGAMAEELLSYSKKAAVKLPFVFSSDAVSS